MTTIALIQNRVSEISLPKINWKPICFFGILISLVSLIFYVFQINELTKGTYLIRNYDSQLNSLSQENINLETSFAQINFLAAAQQKSAEMDFQKTTAVKYVQILNNSLADAK